MCWPSPVESRCRRWDGGRALELVDAAHGLDDRRIGRIGAKRAVAVPKARQRRVHDGRPPIVHRLVAEAHTVQRPRFEVFGEYVELADEVQHEVPTFVGFRVDTDAAFAQVAAQERGTDPSAIGIFDPRGGPPPGIPGDRMFDLDDLGPEPPKQLRGKGERGHLFECQNPNA